MSPNDRGTSNTFYFGQDVRIGALKLTLVSYSRSDPIPNTDGEVAHIFMFDAHNEGAEQLGIQWPMQMFVREIEKDGTVTAGNWWESWRSEQAAGIPKWDPLLDSLRGASSAGSQSQLRGRTVMLMQLVSLPIPPTASAEKTWATLLICSGSCHRTTAIALVRIPAAQVSRVMEAQSTQSRSLPLPLLSTVTSTAGPSHEAVLMCI